MRRVWFAVFVLILSGSISPAQNAPAPSSSTNISLAVPGLIHFTNENLDTVLQLYSRLTDRTVLRHPGVKPSAFSLTMTNRTREEALQAVEGLLSRQGIAMIPDGPKFVLVVAQTDRRTVTPRSERFVPPYPRGAQSRTNDLAMPDGMLDFRDATIWQAAYVYGAFADRNFTNVGRLPDVKIELRTASALTRAEMCYAFETLFDWHGLRIVTNPDRTFTLAPRGR